MITTGGPRTSPPSTLNQLFFDAVATYHKPDALQVKRNGRYEPISHDTLAERIRRTAFGLEELGVRAGDRIAILSENRPEWAIADFACLMLGVADVPIYPNLPSDQVGFILRDSGAVAIFVSNADQAAKIAP
ncbi:MAG TPA: AMP-binding protein, partial [Gemmatimonadaceae bacterium]|nr:AMP-binding protein [Gemmatimonadaceae bacterium]